MSYGNASLARHSREGGNPLCGYTKSKWVPAFSGTTVLVSESSIYTASASFPRRGNRTADSPFPATRYHHSHDLTFVIPAKAGIHCAGTQSQNGSPLSRGPQSLSASHRFTPQVRHSREGEIALQIRHFPRPDIIIPTTSHSSFPRRRESIVRAYKVKMGPRLRGDDDFL